MFTMKSTQMKAMQGAMESYARSVVESVAESEGFNASEALEAVGFPLVEVTKTKSSKSVLLPWCGTVNTSCCSGIRVNHGLYTQCTRQSEGDYCSTCSKNGGPKYGNISSRSSDDFEHASKVVKYSKVMEKLGISREEAEAAAAFAGVTISSSDFEKVTGGRRGRPRKLVDTSSSDSEGEPKKRGRPKKAKTVVSHSAGDDLIASLMANAAEASDSGSDSSVASSEEKAAAKAVAKAAKAEKQSVEKAAKLASKAAEKAAKLAAKEVLKLEMAAEKAAKAEQQSVEKAAEKAAKAEQQSVEKAAKLAEKLASKAAEKAVKDAAKEVLKLEMAAAKAAEKAAKAEKQSAEKAVKLAEKAEKQSADMAEKLAAAALLKLEAAAEEILNEEDAKLEVASDGESSEVEEEEELEEESEVEVEEFTWLEVDYILNPSTGEMYDKTVFEETGEGESVGTYMGGEVTFL